MKAMTCPMKMAVVGAGPVGLALALQVSRLLPVAEVTLFDGRAQEPSADADPRTLALSLGSIQALQRLRVWADIAPQARAIREVRVSQQSPALLSWLPGTGSEPMLRLRAEDEGVEQLGAVAHYGAIVGPLQAAWLDACQREPQRLCSRFETRVNALKPRGHTVEVDAGVVDTFDLAVVAEGGLFVNRPRPAWSRSYAQTAWVGEVTLEGSDPGVAHERFTPHGPVALLPLPDRPDGAQRAALVWCVRSDDDPVRALDSEQRRAVLDTLFAPGTGRIAAVSSLRSFDLKLSAERHLVEGRTVRIGNAAQTLHPVAGQGLNLGLRDAHALATRLARGDDVEQALSGLQAQRALDRWAMLAATDFLAQSFTWQGPGLNTLRGLGLAALQMTRPLRSRLAWHMMFGTR